MLAFGKKQPTFNVGKHDVEITKVEIKASQNRPEIELVHITVRKLDTDKIRTFSFIYDPDYNDLAEQLLKAVFGEDVPDVGVDDFKGRKCCIELFKNNEHLNVKSFSTYTEERNYRKEISGVGMTKSYLDPDSDELYDLDEL